MNNLSIEEIHKIREEHAALTRDMTFDEYKAELHSDIKPLLNLLKSMKSERKAHYSLEREMLIVAEPPAEYKTQSKSDL